MTEAAIRPVRDADIPVIEAGLRALNVQLGDPYPQQSATLARALKGSGAPAFALMAEAGDEFQGVVLAQPLYSTLRGAAGLYVSDIWVSETARGQGLGRRLLAAAAIEGRARWDARFLKLTVQDHNPEARRFYEREGFRFLAADHSLVLETGGLDRLTGEHA